MTHKFGVIKSFCLIFPAFSFSLFSQTLFGVELSGFQNKVSEICPQGECDFYELNVVEKSEFRGLALYYNNINSYLVDKNDINILEAGLATVLNDEQWFAVTGRFQVLLIKAPGLEIVFSDKSLSLKNQQVFQKTETFIKIVDKSQLTSIATELGKIRYAHLWEPLARLSMLVESALVIIHTYIVGNWGLALVIFSVLLKLVLLPVGVMTVRLQRRMSQVQAKLAPKLAIIKANYDGEEAHNRLMSAHKELGVTPFYTLKPMLGAFIQIPVLIAVFNALGEMPQFDGQTFLWIENLAYPDTIGRLPFVIPMFGDIVSLLPFIMTGVTLFSTVTFQNRYASEVEVMRQKRNLYLMSVAFFVLFYPFPAVMVLYWALNNLLHIIQQKVIKI